MQLFNSNGDMDGYWSCCVEESRLAGESKYLTNAGLVYRWLDYVSKVAPDKDIPYTEYNSAYFETEQAAYDKYLLSVVEEKWVTNI